MKIRIIHKSKQRGSALLTTLFICSLLALGLAGYLTLIEQQNFLSARSQTWNMAMAVVESGIEDGLEQYQSNSNSLASNGYGSIGNNQYSKTNTLDDGNSYVVNINAANPGGPLITAKASLNLPSIASTFYGALGLGNSTPNSVSRAVQVTCAQGNNFNAAVIVRQGIDLKGNGVYTDSFDSSDPTKSSNGVYCSSLYSGDHGDVATIAGVSSSVSVQNGNIYGKVHTGPGCPVSVGPNGAVGTHTWQAANSGFEPGYVLQDASYVINSISLPPGNWLPPTGGFAVINNYNFSTNVVTSSTLPSPWPAGGVQTNAGSTTVSTVPSPIPAGLHTNAPSSFTSSTLPSPIPPGTTTNVLTTNMTTASYPAAGSYMGGVTTNYVGGKKNKPITGYTYNFINGYSYTYNTYTYTYPSISYTYDYTVTNTVSSTNTYDYVLLPGHTNKIVGTIPSGKTVFVQPSIPPTNAVLIITGGLTGNENFVIPNNARLVLYVDTSVSISGNGVVNQNGYAGSFVVYCTTNVTSFTLAGNGAFTGVLYAPNADVSLKGGGNNNQDFSGCLIANSLGMNGHFSFHYDEALSHDPANGRFLITGWQEINPNQ